MALALSLYLPSHVFANGNDFKFIESREKTSEDIPLEFIPEKSTYERGRLRIWGRVKSRVVNRPYDSVKVTFTLYGGRGGDLVAREYTYASPDAIGPGQTGYINEFMIKCDISQLNVIEYNVTGK